jgi:solute carrier family 31 (copper transporter), member 1
MDGGMVMSMGNMLAYLHFTPGDNLWFLGWAPYGKGAMVGACVGLFLLAIIERWLASMKAVMEMHWHTRYVGYHIHLSLDLYVYFFALY